MQALERLQIEVPVFQAPIGSIASVELAAAVSNAGGWGAARQSLKLRFLRVCSPTHFSDAFRKLSGIVAV